MILAVSVISISLLYNQEIKLFTGMMSADEKPEPALSDPICFVKTMTSGASGGAMVIETCIPLSDFESLGCDRSVLEYIYKHTNLLEREEPIVKFRNAMGLPDGISEEEYEKCVAIIHEKRPTTSLKALPQRERTIQHLTDSVMSAKTYDDKLDVIQKTISQTNLGEFSQIVLTDLKSNYSDGEKIQFNLTVFGYYNWCLFPHLSVYHEKYEKPVWQSGVAAHCPAPAEVSSPRVSYWKSADFYQFPSCRYQGMHTVIGESFEFGPKMVGQYFCHGAKEFQIPKTIHVSIPLGASDPNQKRNLEPFQIIASWGDYINFTNNDAATHVILGESERTRITDGVEFHATLEPGQSFQIQMQNNRTNWIFAENTENKRLEWISGIITVE